MKNKPIIDFCNDNDPNTVMSIRKLNKTLVGCFRWIRSIYPENFIKHSKWLEGLRLEYIQSVVKIELSFHSGADFFIPFTTSLFHNIQWFMAMNDNCALGFVLNLSHDWRSCVMTFIITHVVNNRDIFTSNTQACKLK